MRIVADIPHPRMKISFFAYEGKFTAKFEKHRLEHLIKFRELPADITAEQLVAKLDKDMIKHIEISLDKLGKQHSEWVDKLMDNNQEAFPQIV